MASVKYSSVTKRFGDVVAVHDLHIDIADKEFLVFVGPSGCGKTTSLRLLAGLEEVDEGEISIGDTVVNDILPKDRGHRDGLPELRAVSTHECVRQPLLRPQTATHLQIRNRQPREGSCIHSRHRPAAQQKTETASPAANANVSRWDEPSCAIRKSS